MKKNALALLSLLALAVSGCTPTTTTTTSIGTSSDTSIETSQTSTSQSTSSFVPTGGCDFNPKVTTKTLSKEVYVNKTLAGLLGQFAGFLSGYEFATWTSPLTGLPEHWFDFINGPYAGNYTYFTPSSTYKYNRLNKASESAVTEGLDPDDKVVWSDDDYHIDILTQYALKEKGYSKHGNKETWKKYKVSDWGGGSDAMMLINSKNLLAPFTGTIEAGNRYGWCTEAYIETETVGMNAPGMPNLATELVDTYGSNVGYFDSVIWGKFYAAMYSLAYFETDIKVVLEKAKEVMPKGSYPYKTYLKAFEAYNAHKSNYKDGAHEIENFRTNLYRIDNIQTDPNVNGGLTILSFLYGKNDYMQTAKYASVMGYDGDCTAATCCGAMGILKGFHPESGNEYDTKINNLLYHDGKGVYHNDVTTNYDARILSSEYPVNQKIDDIIKMYQDNFEMFLIQKGGKINESSYDIPTTELIKDHSELFDNYDAENRDISNFRFKNGTLTAETETENTNSHSGFAYFKLVNTSTAEAYHSYSLHKGLTYRLTTYVKPTKATQISLFARSNGTIFKEETFCSPTNSIIAKSFVFTAQEDSVDVGFKFASNAAKNDTLYFDDFMLEEINAPIISEVSTSKLTLYTGKYIKTISRPESVKIGQEIMLCVEYRQYSGTRIFADLVRNSTSFGGFVLSNTSKDSTSGSAIVEIPYIFESDSDAVQLTFTGSKVYVGNITIKQNAQYMFR